MHKTQQNNGKNTLKLTLVSTILLLLISACSPTQEPTINTPSKISGIQNLILTEKDLQQIGMVSDHLAQLKELKLTPNEGDCFIEQSQDGSSSQAQSGICSYVIPSLNNTEVIIQLQKFTNEADRNGSYQYNSLHLRSSKGLISENVYGDMSRFYVNNENDYGAEFNEGGISFYSLFIAKNEFIIQVHSKGSEDAKESIEKTGQLILSKFE